MARIVRWVHIAAGTLALWSALAVLTYDLTLGGYAAAHGDRLWFVAAYAAAQIAVLFVLVRDTPAVAWVASAKAILALLLLLAFATPAGPMWTTLGPARYVYALFDFRDRPELKIVLMAYVFLGRGAWNVFSAFILTERWWRPLRMQRPFVGRALTLLFTVLLVGCMWGFFELIRMDARNFSPEAHAVARLVLDGIDCDTLRAREGTRTSDVRQRGDHKYDVDIAWSCTDTRVVVRTADGRLGTARGPRRECCSSGT